MGGRPPARSVRDLADGLDVETHYWDVQGNRHDATDASLLAILRAMGVALDDDDPAQVAAAVDAFVDELPHAVTDPVVAWGDDALRGVVVVPEARVATVAFTLIAEDGAESSWKLPVGELPVVDAPPPGRPGPRPGPGEQLRAFELPGPFPVGYHQLVVERGRNRVVADVLVAPQRVAELERHERLWGIFAPVYALPGGTGIGAHVGNLDVLGEAMDRVGGKVVATLPLLAAYLSEPFDPSPYAPVSRRFWNELFCDLAALPELAAAPAAAENLTGLRSFGHAANVKGRLFDYRHQYGYVRGVLEDVVATRGSWPARLRDSFEQFLADHPVASDYARFRAYAERQGSGWHAWAEPQRSGKIGADDVDPDVVAVHEFAQHAMARDLTRLEDGLERRGQRLYLDLPVGAHGDGYDTWRHREAFAWGVGAGAPPDDFFEQGQNWGFPPLRPHAPGNASLFHFRDVVRHHMRAAGILRLDHAMCLERLYWVPDGSAAADGVYVRYPREAMVAVLAIESQRTGCVVVGEDLGTVSDTIRAAMDEHGLMGMYVAEFAQPSHPGAELEEPCAHQLASIDTHDTPTFAGWLHALDIDRRHMFGLLDDAGADDARAERRRQVDNLIDHLVRRGFVPAGTGPSDEGHLLDGLLRLLGTSDARTMLVAVDDLVLERNPQNVPGTMIDRPNWVQRVRATVPELFDDPEIAVTLEALQGCRLGSYLRTLEDEEANRADAGAGR